MQDRPNVLELLAAVRGFLEEEIVPALEGRRRFLALVSANVLMIVARELEGEEASLLTEWTSLAHLLGEDATSPPARLTGLRAAVDNWTRVLAERIRTGELEDGPSREAVRRHVEATVRAKLEVANPRYLAGPGVLGSSP
ncbi:MAG TPA: DUF6285 domain-containing protein [Candidatus Binatus sp.]|jgi:Domain of unknown function (DUF6285)|nr:DUF6285 domain-containing protein [Candidatus Binatus sp.]